MNNRKYLLDVLQETKKEMFKVESIKKRIESQVRRTIMGYMDKVYVGTKDRFSINTYYEYYGHRVNFSEFLQKVEIVVYFVQCENISPENEKLIDKFKKDFNDNIQHFDFGNLKINPVEYKRAKFFLEDVILNGIKM